MEWSIVNVLALVIVGISMVVMGYESITNGSIGYPTEPLMIIIGYFFGVRQGSTNGLLSKQNSK